MPSRTRQCLSTWAEDRALQRCNPSADSGAETEARADDKPPGFLGFGISTQATNLRGTTPRPFDRMSPPQLANADQSEFQFTLNQDSGMGRQPVSAGSFRKGPALSVSRTIPVA